MYVLVAWLLQPAPIGNSSLNCNNVFSNRLLPSERMIFEFSMASLTLCCGVQSGRTFLDPEEKLRRIAMQQEQVAAGRAGAKSVSSEEARRAAINAEAEAERLAKSANASSGTGIEGANTQVDGATRPMTPKD